jgi:peroxiredoxin
MNKTLLFYILCCLALVQCTPKLHDAKLELEYIKADSTLWAEYELEGEILAELYAENEDSLYIKAVELEEYADRKNRDLAIEYSATPSGLKRCFMLRLDIEKDTLQNILSKLPHDLRKSECAKAIKKHIATEQIEVGMEFFPIDAVNADGHKIAWNEYRNKNILLIYGGLGCMGRYGRRELVSLRKEYTDDNLAIIIYYSVSTLEELKEFRNQYSDDYIFISELMSDYSPFKIKYGVQSTPTCFVIDKSGTVVLKTIGFDASQVKTTIN